MKRGGEPHECVRGNSRRREGQREGPEADLGPGALRDDTEASAAAAVWARLTVGGHEAREVIGA